MLQQNTSKNFDHSLQAKCISALRFAKEKILQEAENQSELKELVSRLEIVLFSAEKSRSSNLLECFVDLMVALKRMEKHLPITRSSLRPIGLQVATSNSIAPIHLEWNYHNPNSLFIIEYANFEETTKPEWRLYSKTRSTSFQVRDLPQGQSYWFRISAAAGTA